MMKIYYLHRLLIPGFLTTSRTTLETPGLTCHQSGFEWFTFYIMIQLFNQRKLAGKIIVWGNFLNDKSHYLLSQTVIINHLNEKISASNGLVQLSFRNPPDTLSSVLYRLSQALNLLKIHPSRSVVLWHFFCSNHFVLAIQLAGHSIGKKTFTFLEIFLRDKNGK